MDQHHEALTITCRNCAQTFEQQYRGSFPWPPEICGACGSHNITAEPAAIDEASLEPQSIRQHRELPPEPSHPDDSIQRRTDWHDRDAGCPPYGAQRNPSISVDEWRTLDTDGEIIDGPRRSFPHAAAPPSGRLVCDNFALAGPEPDRIDPRMDDPEPEFDGPPNLRRTASPAATLADRRHAELTDIRRAFRDALERFDTLFPARTRDEYQHEARARIADALRYLAANVSSFGSKENPGSTYCYTHQTWRACSENSAAAGICERH